MLKCLRYKQFMILLIQIKKNIYLEWHFAISILEQHNTTITILIELYLQIMEMII